MKRKVAAENPHVALYALGVSLIVLDNMKKKVHVREYDLPSTSQLSLY